ncbi:MAG: glycosyltransferase [Candidatus Heimdallarchaeota archaeon]|nr:glycosyltransferase [Candidatus Heimdallarchaeota archaeon]
MRILHLADGPRNIRAERAALLAKQIGKYKLFITGNITQKIIEKDIFEKNYYLPLQPRNLVGLQLKNILEELKSIIEEVDPDLIHTHNIFMANIAQKLDVPFVYDDHELWSQEIKYSKKTSIKGMGTKTLQKILYPRWEEQIATSKVIFVPSTGIQRFYKKKYDSRYVFKLPNMPLLNEVNKIEFNEPVKKELHTVAIGVRTTSKFSSRNIDEFINLWEEKSSIGKLIIIGQNDLESKKNLISTGRISHFECYQVASTAHVGIIPFKPHPYHEFSGANKAYIYLHSGLVLVVPETQKEFTKIIDDLDQGFYFNNYQQIATYLEEHKKDLLNIDKKSIIDIAREQFVLDNYQENLIQGYKIALEKQEE